MDLRYADAVVLYKASDAEYGVVPFDWAWVEKRTSRYLEVRGVRVSYATGRPLSDSQQPKDYGYMWHAPALDQTPMRYRFTDVVIKVEPFNLCDLEEVTRETKLEDLFEEGETLEESVREIRKRCEQDNIPMDAEIIAIIGDEVLVRYTRPETLRERTIRLYHSPTIEWLKSQRAESYRAKRRAELLEELDQLDKEQPQ